MRDFSITGIPTKDYYDFHGEPESRIMFGSTAIYASAALANQGCGYCVQWANQLRSGQKIAHPLDRRRGQV